MEEEALSSRLSTQEKLIIAQAIYKFGAINWEKISGLLQAHPLIREKDAPADNFGPAAVEAYYIGLMTEIGINVPAQDATKPQAKVHLRLAQTFYIARLEELKTSIAEYETRFSTLMAEITAIKSGSMDKTLKDEMRAVLARKFGKRLLDSWVPDHEAVKAAIEAGRPTDSELEQAAEAQTTAKEDTATAEKTVPQEGAESQNMTAAESDSQADTVLAESAKQGTDVEDSQVPILELETPPTAGDGDVEMVEQDPPTRKLSPVKGRVATPVPHEEPASSSPIDVKRKDSAPSSPASELSSAPDDEDKASPIKTKGSRAVGKRKASAQPRGAPTSKRSTRRRTTATPSAPVLDEMTTTAADQADAGDEETEPQEKMQVEETAEVETPAPVEEDEPPKRGTRQSKRDSTAGRNKKATSPASSTRNSSPAPMRRRGSVSSAQSGTPAADERRSSRRVPKERGMRDVVVSKLAREQSAAVESVKEDEEEEEEPERPPTRASRRTRANMTPREDSAAQESAKEEEVDEPEPASTRSRASRRSKGDVTPRAATVEQDDAIDETGAQDDEGAQQEDEEERPSTRSSRRARENATPAADKVREAASERKSTRRSIAASAAEPDDEKPEVVEETPVPKDKRVAKRPRQSSPREIKAVQKMLNSLLDQISGHRNGNIFLQPVRKSEAPDYHNVIKRPMDLKTVRTRIRDGTITSLEEFERDIMLIFANATMYNTKGSQLHDMAMEMMKDAEGHIAHLKTVQHNMAR